MADVTPGRDGPTLRLDEVESALLRRLTGEMRALLTGSRTGNGPVLDRLFPAAYDEPDDESTYREMVHDSLVTEKLEALDTISTALAGPTEVTLPREAFATWLACLTDMRLAIGVRLNVDEERMGAEIDPDDPDAQALAILHWLGWLQESLLREAPA